ncbi:hypothetical protein L6164_002009 [Bauhinia variegata]|uniref:Uncharacterized protein n=1 Tax=Bauhinia variegata TaxID=167791 RepID=A0ACB9PWV5_BAUVA|nr:hypothetical protein L6164_002009 [Bauhinia variegata]
MVWVVSPTVDRSAQELHPSMHRSKKRTGDLAIEIDLEKAYDNVRKGFLVAPPHRTTRGPLSPYLFVICMEKLSLAISGEVNARRWIPIKASRGGPGISHLLFADDVLFFCKATSSQVHLAKDMLDRFVAASGLKVNAAKSRAFSSVRITRGCKGHLAASLGFD